MCYVTAKKGALGQWGVVLADKPSDTVRSIYNELAFEEHIQVTGLSKGQAVSLAEDLNRQIAERLSVCA